MQYATGDNFQDPLVEPSADSVVFLTTQGNSTIPRNQIVRLPRGGET